MCTLRKENIWIMEEILLIKKGNVRNENSKSVFLKTCKTWNEVKFEKWLAYPYIQTVSITSIKLG